MIEVNEAKTLDEIKKIVAKILEVPPEKVGVDTHFVEELGADSMMALEIMAMLEKKFGINIPESDLPKLSTLKQTTSLVMSLIGK